MNRINFKSPYSIGKQGKSTGLIGRDFRREGEREREKDIG